MKLIKPLKDFKESLEKEELLRIAAKYPHIPKAFKDSKQLFLYDHLLEYNNVEVTGRRKTNAIKNFTIFVMNTCNTKAKKDYFCDFAKKEGMLENYFLYFKEQTKNCRRIRTPEEFQKKPTKNAKTKLKDWLSATEKNKYNSNVERIENAKNAAKRLCNSEFIKKAKRELNSNSEEIRYAMIKFVYLMYEKLDDYDIREYLTSFDSESLPANIKY